MKNTNLLRKIAAIVLCVVLAFLLLALATNVFYLARFISAMSEYTIGIFNFVEAILSNILMIAAMAIAVFLLFKSRGDKLWIVVGVLALVSALLNVYPAFGWRAWVSNILHLVAASSFLAVLLLMLKKPTKNLWIAPAAILGVATLFAFVFTLIGQSALENTVGYLVNVLQIVAIVLGGMWLQSLNAAPAEESQQQSNQQTKYQEVPQVSGQRDILLHIMLMIFVGPVYMYYWIYRFTQYINTICRVEQRRGPVPQLLLCIFVPFYIVYWTYKSAQLWDEYSLQNGDHESITTLCVILAIFISIAPPIIMQMKVNEFYQRSANAQPAPAPQPVAQPAPQSAPAAAPKSEPAAAPAPSVESDTIESIKKYKELLDQGVITEEEFQSKKKQLLGL